MRVSEQWLREWVPVAADASQISSKLVMAGLELEIEPALNAAFSKVVVARIESIAPHPDADRLRVCQVNAGEGSLRQIVCGAPNARAGLVIPCALPGAQLPGGLDIKVGQLRGVESAGMLCSARELQLSEKHEGLMELDAGAPIGTPLRDYLLLDDQILHLELTPNRGDCLSIRGLAREVGALFQQTLSAPEVPAATVSSDSVRGVAVESAADTPCFLGRMITGLDAAARTPDWMVERLRKSGIRSIHPLVDVTNYVLIELGQPMHAYDADKLTGDLRARRALKGESLTLLNDQTIELDGELIIADDRGPLGLAGAMGGADSAVSAQTANVFLESAAFAQDAVAGVGRRHKLTSDALYRFERGVDPSGQRLALERATALVLEICGGAAGPICADGAETPAPIEVPLRLQRIHDLVGISPTADEVERLLARLDIRLRSTGEYKWSATVPYWRADLRIEEDLIEEVARLYGYDKIESRPYAAQIPPSSPREGRLDSFRARDLLVARGYQEEVSLAFTDKSVQDVIHPEATPIALDNPLAETLSVMRSTHWSNLLQVYGYNRARQLKRLRLFEYGVCFERGEDGEMIETPKLSGLASGTVVHEQWGLPARAVDFFDAKADVEALLQACAQPVRFVAAQCAALHPGQCAQILIGGKIAGWIGRLHPRVQAALDLAEAPILFEIDWTLMREIRVPSPQPISEFPASRRDLAVVVPESVPAQSLNDVAARAAGNLLKTAFVFDVYRGSGLPDACKSMALGLIFQDSSRTLQDEDVESAVKLVSDALSTELGAILRS